MSIPDRRDRHFEPGRLWSLWDIMRAIPGEAFFKAYEQAATFHQFLTHFDANNWVVLRQDDYSAQLERVSVLATELNAMGLTGSALPFERAKELLETARPGEFDGTPGFELDRILMARIARALSSGTSRVPDDMRSHVLLSVDPRMAKFYRNAEPYGREVFDNFPSANEDLAEAATCLSLDRATACVMHLMRVLEAGLRALSASVGVSEQSDWGSYLRLIDKELKARVEAAGARSADEQFYAEAAADMDNLRRAYRNPTMHPDRSYSVERAEEIFNAVGTFMRHLATRLHE